MSETLLTYTDPVRDEQGTYIVRALEGKHPTGCGRAGSSFCRPQGTAT
jgi:hypothetical protein